MSNTPTDTSDAQASTSSADDGDASNGFVIEINVDASGAITVAVESASDESAEEGGQSGGEGSDDDDQAQPVKNIKECLTLVLDIYRNKGQMTSGDDDMASGYASQAGQSGSAASGSNQ